MPSKQHLEELQTNITGLKAYFAPLLNDSDPVQSWKFLDAIDFLDDWEEDINAKLAVLELHKPSIFERIKNWFKGE